MLILSNLFIMDYKNKYLKYKKKYLLLKNNIQRGGKQNIIIHISGSSGSGKSYLSKKLKDKFGSKIEFIELDKVRKIYVEQNFKEPDYKKITNFNKEKFQEYLDKLIKNKNKPIIIEGLNHFHWWDMEHYYELYATHKFYIDLDVDTIFKQKCNRFIEGAFHNEEKKNRILQNLIKNEEYWLDRIQADFKSNCSFEKINKFTTMWDTDYKKMGYKFMTSDEIYNSISKILKDI
jgi:adenylate kinase family enzyme